ncbi:hypothetical protein [Microtetraspora malaysiensis]|uniref:hypothetical protein n=1 Tax=Microtetraspora malaysiensis TaxID=161358 RepID=UPI003D93BD73
MLYAVRVAEHVLHLSCVTGRRNPNEVVDRHDAIEQRELTLWQEAPPALPTRSFYFPAWWPMLEMPIVKNSMVMDG